MANIVSTLGGIALIVFGLFQWAAVSEWLDTLGVYWLLSLIVSFFLAFIPILGSVLAAMGAHNGYHWSTPTSVAVFIVPPALVYGFLAVRRG